MNKALFDSVYSMSVMSLPQKTGGNKYMYVLTFNDNTNSETIISNKPGLVTMEVFNLIYSKIPNPPAPPKNRLINHGAVNPNEAFIWGLVLGISLAIAVGCILIYKFL